MKCKHCNGTGATNWYVNRAFVTCPYCGGTGEMEGNMTNEEWFCSLSTEEKVKALLDLRERIRQKMRGEIGSENKFHKGDYYREWLKEKHE